MVVKIEKRKLTDKEIEIFVSGIKETPNIVGYRKKEWRNFGKVFVATVGGETVGVAVNTELTKGWSETPALFVVEKYRFQGIGKQLFFKAIDDFKKRSKNIYYVSRNPIVIRWMKEEGMVFNKITFLPLPVLLHILHKSLSFYRIKEYTRKLFVFPNQPPFLHAFKITH